MTYSRRKILGLIGGGTILAASAAAGGFLATRSPDKALAPWALAGQYPDLRMRALSFALLAPNPHNRQPWVAALQGADTVILYRNSALNLPETDPNERQLTIGMGCFIELMVQGAAQEGTGVELELFPKGTDKNAPVVVARFTGEATPEPLFQQVLIRHTNRSLYNQSAVSSSEIAVIVNSPGQVQGAVIAASSKKTMVSDIQKLASAAIAIEANTPRTHAESIHLTRIGKAEIEANPDGISLGGPLMDSLGALGILNRVSALDPNSSAFATAITMQTDAVATTPAFFWVTTPANKRTDQIAAGRAWVRAHLQATALGLSVQPISQALQEYAEMDMPYRKIHSMLAQQGETVQMLGRLGYGPSQSPAPRWPLETRLKNA